MSEETPVIPLSHALVKAERPSLDLQLDGTSWSETDDDYGRETTPSRLMFVGSRVLPALAYEPLTDRVIGLREWGTQRVLPLRPYRADPDSANKSSMVVTATSGDARAELVYEQGSWCLRDLAGTSELTLDGDRVSEIRLRSGHEVGFGGRTLVAESPRSISLRHFLGRLLGWSSDHAATIDHALRSIRIARTGRATLVLRGLGNLVPIAHSLHRRCFGPDSPFVLSNPRRGNASETARSPANCVSGVEALALAKGGTLCVRARRLPSDIGAVLAAIREPSSNVLLMLCEPATKRNEQTVATTPIDIPALSSRRDEVPRIVTEYVDDAISLLQAPEGCVSREDVAWLVELEALVGVMTMADLERAVIRMVALRKTGNVARAAHLLGMAGVSLSRWFERRWVKGQRGQHAG